MPTRAELITEIAQKIRTYRSNELTITLDEAHVRRWIEQFDAEDQEAVLTETNALLSKCYFSTEKIDQFLSAIIESPKIWGDDGIKKAIEYTQFLNIQQKGTSQAYLLKRLAELLKERYDLDLPTTPSDKTNRYIYLDDCMFSSNRLKWDIRDWINDAHENATLDIIFLAAHSYGKKYIKEKVLDELCASKKINYTIRAEKDFRNFRQDWYYYDCIWPKEIRDENIDAYINLLQSLTNDDSTELVQKLFRQREYKSDLYTGQESRERFEKALLKAGAFIYSVCANPGKTMRPMGYEIFASLGFGAFFATDRNISNNCPLAFWWGDSSADEYHPFSRWYPLLPRKTNEVNDDGYVWE